MILMKNVWLGIWWKNWGNFILSMHLVYNLMLLMCFFIETIRTAIVHLFYLNKRLRPKKKKRSYFRSLNWETSLPLFSQEPSQNVTGATTGSIEETSNGVSKSGANLSGKAEITEEQRARMEANRLKALEKRAAQALSSQAI